VVHFIADLWLHFSCGFSCWVILWIVAFSGPACEVVKYLETAMDCGRCAGGHEVLTNVNHSFQIASIKKSTISKCHVNCSCHHSVRNNVIHRNIWLGQQT